MPDRKQAERIRRTAEEAIALLGTGRQVTPLSVRFPDFDLAEAYAVASKVCDLRKTRGEMPVGRKIGFTNRAAWSGYGISAPIWSYMFQSTVHHLAANRGTFSLAGLPEPRIEPEVALHLACEPHAGMSEAELVGCIDWVAHGFEVVHSVFPRWQFAAADAVAACGVHSALLLGDKHDISGARAEWADALSSFDVELVRSDGLTRLGRAANVLGGPLEALCFLVQELARYPASQPLGAGEIVTTGTLTEAMPAVAGHTWSTQLRGIEIEGVQLSLQ
jgi:2-oxo-3-hexenedioate decarboxylase